MPLKKDLINALQRYKNPEDDDFYVARQNDEHLKELKARLLTEYSRENVVRFVNTLDKYYSAGLKFIPEAVLLVSDYITLEFTQNDLQSIAANSKINSLLVDKMRYDVSFFLFPFNRNSKKENIDQISFVSKFFHQFNSNYPIWDTNLKLFFLHHFPSKFASGMPYTYTEYCEIYDEVLADDRIKWKGSINDFDNAAWIIGDQIRRKENEERKARKKTQK